MKNDFIPTGNGNIDAFQENLVTKVGIHTSALGLDPDQVNASIQIINENRASYTKMNSKKAESKAATEDYYNDRKKAIAEIRRLAKQIKSSKTYTTGIGDDIGVIGPEQQFKSSVEKKPVLKASVNGNVVKINFRKEGTHGIKLYSKRGSETEFTFLAINFASPYSDKREKLDPAKPEQREYYAYYFETDGELGQRSDVLKMVVP